MTTSGIFSENQSERALSWGRITSKNSFGFIIKYFAKNFITLFHLHLRGKQDLISERFHKITGKGERKIYIPLG